MAEKILWHTISALETAELLGTDLEAGLSDEEAEKRIWELGKNALPEKKPLSDFQIFLSQFKNVFTFILAAAALIVFLLGDRTDAFVISIVIVVAAIFGFWEERKASQAMQKLKKALAVQIVVSRGGKKKTVLQEELAPGDIIFLRSGDSIPADGRLAKAQDLRVSEAPLTGEWLSASKNIFSLPPETPLADRDNMVYAGSLVESGIGKAVVVSTGKDTEIGKIAELVGQTREEKTPLQKKLIGFSRILAIAIVGISIFIFLGNALRGNDLLQSFEAAVAIAVGGIPEALPIIITVILALGAERILRRKGLIRRLVAVETLGSAHVICFDKTLTLTQGKMEVAGIGSKDESLALKIAAFCNEAFVENPEDPIANWRIKGAPTDVALLLAGAKRGFLPSELEKHSKQAAFLPFSSEWKYQLSLRQEQKKKILYIVGAPEVVFSLSKEVSSYLQSKLAEFTDKGFRVVGLGQKEVVGEIGKGDDLKQIAGEFEFVGLIAFEDPLREDAREAVQNCIKAGMLPVMITGDHRTTAQRVAQTVGIKAEPEHILEGPELDNMSDEEFAGVVESIFVYARTEPKHKIRIVGAWQEKGKVVAMTGDGVNDAPALKKAEIGVAMGSGTEVAKESSDLVLLDDSFSTLVNAVEEGRTILDNLRKAITYAMTNSFAEALIVGTATLFGWPLPMLAVQILWNNVVEDSLPNIAFAFEPKEKDVMKRKPYPFHISLLTKEMKALIFGTSLIYNGLGLLLFFFIWKVLALPLEYARTMVFSFIVVNTVFVIFSYKSLRKNIWQYPIFSNRILNISVVVVLVFLAAAIYIEPMRALLHTVPLGLGSWIVLMVFGLTCATLVEITKRYFIHKGSNET